MKIRTLRNIRKLGKSQNPEMQGVAEIRKIKEIKTSSRKISEYRNTRGGGN